MASMIKQLAAQNLTSAGTAQALTTTATICQSVLIVAKSTNAGSVYVGDSTVDSTNTFPIAAGESYRIEAPQAPGGGADDMDLSTIFWDGGTTNDDIFVIYAQRTN